MIKCKTHRALTFRLRPFDPQNQHCSSKQHLAMAIATFLYLWTKPSIFLVLGCIAAERHCYMSFVVNRLQRYQAHSNFVWKSLQAINMFSNRTRLQSSRRHPSTQHKMEKYKKGRVPLLLSTTLWCEVLLNSAHGILIEANILHRTATIHRWLNQKIIHERQAVFLLLIVVKLFSQKPNSPYQPKCLPQIWFAFENRNTNSCQRSTCETIKIRRIQ